MLYDAEAMRRFVRVELGEDTVPDESTILRFRHLLEQHQVTTAMFDTVKTLLTEKRRRLKGGPLSTRRFPSESRRHPAFSCPLRGRSHHHSRFNSYCRRGLTGTEHPESIW